MARNVAIVFIPDYSADLHKLAFRTPVWLIDTPANRTAAEIEWHNALEWPHISVTLFRAADDLKTLLEQLELEARGVESLEVIGIEPQPAVLAGAGFTRVDETANGFRARR
jgi:hypothetical protein